MIDVLTTEGEGEGEGAVRDAGATEDEDGTPGVGTGEDFARIEEEAIRWREEGSLRLSLKWQASGVFDTKGKILCKELPSCQSIYR